MTNSAAANRPDGGVCNGFATIPEIPVLEVEPKLIAPFSLPQEALTFTPPESSLIQKFKNGDKERKIYNNIELNDQELARLRSLQEKAKTEGKAFLPCICVMASRFLNQARGDVDKAFAAMTASQSWRQEYFAKPMNPREFEQDLQLGIAYFIGRDRELRPTLVFRGKRIPQAWYREKNWDRVIRIVVFCMEYFLRYMIIPGRVEGMNILVDLHGLSMTQVPVSVLERIYKTLGSNYCGRTFKFFVCNMPFTLRVLIGVAKKIISERQAQKLVVINNNSELLADFAAHHIEQDLGGTHPPVKKFVPFPLLPGPFDGGYTKGPGPDRVPRVHEVLTESGVHGRLWDPSKTKHENTKLEYSDVAEAIFEKCNLPIPEICPRGMGTKEDLDKLAAPQEEEPEEDEVLLHDDDNGEDIVVQSAEVRPSSMFGCRCCVNVKNP